MWSNVKISSYKVFWNSVSMCLKFKQALLMKIFNPLWIYPWVSTILLILCILIQICWDVMWMKIGILILALHTNLWMGVFGEWKHLKHSEKIAQWRKIWNLWLLGFGIIVRFQIFFSFMVSFTIKCFARVGVFRP